MRGDVDLALFGRPPPSACRWSWLAGGRRYQPQAAPPGRHHAAQYANSRTLGPRCRSRRRGTAPACARPGSARPGDPSRDVDETARRRRSGPFLARRRRPACAIFSAAREVEQGAAAERRFSARAPAPGRERIALGQVKSLTRSQAASSIAHSSPNAERCGSTGRCRRRASPGISSAALPEGIRAVPNGCSVGNAPGRHAQFALRNLRNVTCRWRRRSDFAVLKHRHVEQVVDVTPVAEAVLEHEAEHAAVRSVSVQRRAVAQPFGWPSVNGESEQQRGGDWLAAPKRHGTSSPCPLRWRRLTLQLSAGGVITCPGPVRRPWHVVAHDPVRALCYPRCISSRRHFGWKPSAE